MCVRLDKALRCSLVSEKFFEPIGVQLYACAMSESFALDVANDSSLSGVRFSNCVDRISNLLKMDSHFNFCSGIAKFKPSDKTSVSIGEIRYVDKLVKCIQLSISPYQLVRSLRICF